MEEKNSKIFTVCRPRRFRLVELLVEGPLRAQTLGRAVVAGAAVAAAAAQADDALFSRFEGGG